MVGDKKIKLLMGITLSEMGGAQKVVYDLISSLPAIYDITLVAFPGGELIQWVEDLEYLKGISVRVIGITQMKREISPFNDIVALFKLYRLMKKGNYDIAHFHSSKMGILGRLAAKMARVPKVYFTVHGWGINEHQPKWIQSVLGFAERLAGNWCTMAMCVSKHHMDVGIKMKWLKPDKTCVIYNGIDIAPILSGGLRNELNVGEDVPLIGTIMRLRKPKQPVYTIEAFNKVLKMGYNAKLIIVGDGPMYKDCKLAIKEHMLEDSVYMLGTRADARELMNDMDIITMFSKWEGLPITIIEAMFAGKPIVASCVGGIPEIIDNGINGFMIDGFDVHEGAEHICNLLEHKDLGFKMGKNGKQKAEKGFTKKRMVKDYERVYRGN